MMTTLLCVLIAFYAGGSVSACLFTVWHVRLFGACGLLLGRNVAAVVAGIALLWPVKAFKFAFPRVPREMSNAKNEAMCMKGAD